MNLSLLQTFLTIVETGNLNKAAQRLNITQSTVTARLNTLESEIGQVLFHRRKSGAELTSAGFKFERYAQLMTDLWRQARQETSLPPEIETVCNMGCHPDLWPELGSVLFERLRDTLPNVAMSAWPGEQVDLDRWLGSGLIDIALCYIPTQREDCTPYSLRNDQLILVSTEQRELMRWDPAYVYVDSGEEFRRSHAAAYPDGDTPTVTIGSALWALEYLLKTGGSAYLPVRLAQTFVDQQTLHVVKGAPVFTRRLYLVANNNASANWPWLPNVVAELSEAA